MKKKLTIYLAGNIQKGKEDDTKEVWSPAHKTKLQELLPHIELVFLDPQIRLDDLSNQTSVFGRDLFSVYSSDLVLVDARSKRGLGVGSEMMFAKTHKIAVISWLPENSHYKRASLEFLGQKVENWTHPFVESLSDYCTASLEEAARWIQEELITEKASIKGPAFLQEAMHHYHETSLPQDIPMQEALGLVQV